MEKKFSSYFVLSVNNKQQNFSKPVSKEKSCLLAEMLLL